jgi:A/G-specific adenine glycosylase
MLVVKCGDRVLLERRRADGLWGGLWSFPEFRDRGSAGEWLDARALAATAIESGLPLRHGFTHFELDITPLIAKVPAPPERLEAGHWLWYNPADPPRLGLAAPVAALIESCLSACGPAAN